MADKLNINTRGVQTRATNPVTPVKYDRERAKLVLMYRFSGADVRLHHTLLASIVYLEVER
jgi:hypothetical protein